jgi:hypothetical protein
MNVIHDHAMIELADYPLLAQLATASTAATHLDARACRYIYIKGLAGINLATIEPQEREFINALGLNIGTDY